MSLSVVGIVTVSTPFFVAAGGGVVSTPADEPGIMVSVPRGKHQLSIEGGSMRASVRGKNQLSEEGQR